MQNLSRVALLLGLAALVVNAGECGSPFFATKEARECCNRGKCAPSNRSDDCCKVSNTSASSTFVVSGKASIPNPLGHIDSAAITAVLTQIQPILTLSSLLRADHTWVGPPPLLAAFNLPLLI